MEVTVKSNAHFFWSKPQYKSVSSKHVRHTSDHFLTEIILCDPAPPTPFLLAHYPVSNTFDTAKCSMLGRFILPLTVLNSLQIKKLGTKGDSTWPMFLET